MAPDQSPSDRAAVGVVGWLRRGGWAAVPIGTIESLVAGGRVVDFPSGGTVYTEADAERLAVMMHGLLRVYMHAGAISSRSSAVARVAEVLNRRRALTIDMIRRLHEGLGLSADVLIRPYDLRGRRSAA
jgi:hypothetical protein